MKISTLMLAAGLLAALPLAAQQLEETEQPPAEEEFQQVPRPPELPDPLQSGQPIEPEVTIIRRDGATIEEYRVNGRVFMIKVTPDAGPEYYLVDRDGDGRMESRMSEIYDDFTVPQWVIFSW